MKKIVTALSITALVLGACGTNDEEPKKDTKVEKHDKKQDKKKEKKTDNIHVHVASTETEDTRPMMENIIKKKNSEGEYEEMIVIEPRGKRKPSTEDSMKSSFINHLANRNNTLERLSTLRYELHHSMRIDEKSIKQKKRLEEIKEELPEDRRHWAYNHSNMKHLKQPINEYTHQYMNMYYKKEFDEYKELLKKDSEMNKALYGVGDKNKNRYQDTYENKMNELNSKMGNALLKSLKEKEKYSYQSSRVFEPTSQCNQKKSVQKNNYQQSNSKVKFKIHPNDRLTKHDLYAIQRAFKNHRKDQELETQHNQLQRRIENENQNEL
ncbi:relaxase MobL [Mammaliicoccus vitulinus]|uniref:relaxase MobL n=1 Tax=Mammaliicoccus vitulinus TaxID=71237 RepID=UPI001868AFB2|nr:relaxase MobL [Mammaliicoccus vitulinus]